MNKRFLGIMSLVLGFGGGALWAVTRKLEQNLGAADEFTMKMICTSDANPGRNWYQAEELALYRAQQPANGNQTVHFVDEYRFPRINRVNDTFTPDRRAAPTRCRLYYIIKHR